MNNIENILKEYKKLKFIEKALQNGWIIYKKKDNNFIYLEHLI